MASGLASVHVACTAIGNRLVIGRLGKDKQTLTSSREVEAEIMAGLVQQMLGQSKGIETKTFALNGKRYELTINLKNECAP